MDMTHFGDWHHLTQIDCSPCQFAIWKLLLYQDSVSIIQQLENVFFEREPPIELSTNNSTVFCREMFTEVWGILMRFWCTYVPSGNWIVERSHCTIKRIATGSHGGGILVQCDSKRLHNCFNSTSQLNIHIPSPHKRHWCCTTSWSHWSRDFQSRCGVSKDPT